jgi:plastocyanin
MRFFNHKPLMPVLGLVMLVVLAGFGCSKKNNPTTPAATATPTPVTGATVVTVSGLTFSPATVTITAGTSVEWTNLQAGGHNVVQIDSLANCASDTAGGFTSGALGAVVTYTHAFPTVGTYYYKCSAHCAGGMEGTVVVH